MRKKRPSARKPARGSARSPHKPRVRKTPSAHFVGRDGSPVLDHYPPKDPSLTIRGPPPVPVGPPTARAPSGPSKAAPAAESNPATAAPGGPAPSSTPVPGASIPLISLERPFDVDEFAQMLGESTIQVEVPREDLAEALRRICDFMGFGIYVYSFRVRPAPDELLKRFVIELQRVDFSAEKGDWTPFQETGRSDSPFGPSGGRR